MKKLKFLLFLVVISSAIVSCKKGDTGDTGPAGPAGANGTNGTNGTTNTSVSHYTIAPGSWSGAIGANYTIITDSAVVDTAKDVVYVYIQESSGWMALSATNVILTNDYMGYSYAPYQVELFYHHPTNAPFISVTIKVVVIHTSGRPAPIDYTNYEEVKRTYNLKD